MKTLAFLGFALLLAASGCDDDKKDDGHDHEGTGACADLIAACHDADEGEGTESAECHDIGHDGVQATCEAERTRCLEACEHSHNDDGGDHDDAGDDAG